MIRTFINRLLGKPDRASGAGPGKRATATAADASGASGDPCQVTRQMRPFTSSAM